MILMTKPLPDHLSLGLRGENIACRYLEGKGFSILTRNYRNPSGRRLGEVDIIAEKDGSIVFVEVKTRSVSSREISTILPEESITSSKLRKLEKIAQYYLRNTKNGSVPYRFDALSILYFPDENRAQVRHIEHMFL